MAGRKSNTKDRYAVNFNHEKTKLIIAHLQLAENRISRNEIIAIANKDVFYKLSKSGYIQEVSKGIYKATTKLKNYTTDRDGKKYSSSGSASHSQAVRHTLSFVPKSVLLRKSYNTSTDIEKEYNRNKQSREYNEKLGKIKNDLREEREQMERAYKESLTYAKDDYDRYSSKMQYLQDRDSVSVRQSWLQEKTCLTPDYQLTFKMNEFEEYIQNLKNYKDTLDEDSKAFSIYSQSIEKLQNITFEGEITINIETITDTYMNREIFLHTVYEQLSGQNQIFLC